MTGCVQLLAGRERILWHDPAPGEKSMQAVAASEAKLKYFLPGFLMRFSEGESVRRVTGRRSEAGSSVFGRRFAHIVRSIREQEQNAPFARSAVRGI